MASQEAAAGRKLGTWTTQGIIPGGVDKEMRSILQGVLGVDPDEADRLVRAAKHNGQGLDFVAEVRLHTEDNPRGWTGGATRYRLHLWADSDGRDRLSLTRTELHVKPNPASRT